MLFGILDKKYLSTGWSYQANDHVRMWLNLLRLKHIWHFALRFAASNDCPHFYFWASSNVKYGAYTTPLPVLSIMKPRWFKLENRKPISAGRLLAGSRKTANYFAPWRIGTTVPLLGTTSVHSLLSIENIVNIFWWYWMFWFYYTRFVLWLLRVTNICWWNNLSF